MDPDAKTAFLGALDEKDGERDPQEGMYRIGTVFGGIIDDYKRRMPYYADDFKKGLTRKTISSSLFMFFATFASTVALGVVIKRNTECPDDGSFDNCKPGSSYLGVTEYPEQVLPEQRITTLARIKERGVE